MKKLIFPFVEIEVPDDFPDGLDIEATGKYANEHPEIAERICLEYERAYRKWIKTDGGKHGQSKNQPEQAKA